MVCYGLHNISDESKFTKKYENVNGSLQTEQGVFDRLIPSRPRRRTQLNGCGS